MTIKPYQLLASFLVNPLTDCIKDNKFIGAFEGFINPDLSLRNTFFQPYHPEKKPLIGATSIISAPLSLLIIALEFTYSAVCLTIKSIFELLVFQPRLALTDIATVGIAVLFATGMAIAAVLSTLVNLIDFIGSVIVTLKNNNSVESMPVESVELEDYACTEDSEEPLSSETAQTTNTLPGLYAALRK